MRYVIFLFIVMYCLGCTKRTWDNPYDKDSTPEALIGKKYKGGIIISSNLIVAEKVIGHYSWQQAVNACADYSVTVNGLKYDNWRLPYDYELLMLREYNIKKTNTYYNTSGDYPSDYYWTAAENGDNALLYGLGDGYSFDGFYFPKVSTNPVLPVQDY